VKKSKKRTCEALGVGVNLGPVTFYLFPYLELVAKSLQVSSFSFGPV
jgi:hypothetical protein